MDASTHIQVSKAERWSRNALNQLCLRKLRPFRERAARYETRNLRHWKFESRTWAGKDLAPLARSARGAHSWPRFPAVVRWPCWLALPAIRNAPQCRPWNEWPRPSKETREQFAG